MVKSEYPFDVDLTANSLPVLVVSSRQEDHELFNVFLDSGGYELHHAFTLEEALTVMQHSPVRVVITERTLTDGSWFDVRPPTSSAKAPLVIVFSDPEDASSWAQAFNVGAFDELFRPRVEKIVEGSVSLAGVGWSRRLEMGSARGNAMLPVDRDMIGPAPKKARSAASRTRRAGSRSL